MAVPIWQDQTKTLYSVDDNVQFFFRKDSDTSYFYSGKASAKPGTSYPTIRLNDVVAGLVSPGYITGVNVLGNFTVTGRTSPTIYVDFMSNGTKITDSSGVQFNPDWSYRSASGQTIHTSPSVDMFSCFRFHIVYVNSFGSWESFAVEGNVTESDDVTRHTYAAEYNNAQTFNRGKIDYVNELVHKYTINTGYMLDDAAAKIPEILNSAQVYLFDKSAVVVRPIIITNTATEYKTYKGNGNRLSQYTITAELAQDRIRR